MRTWILALGLGLGLGASPANADVAGIAANVSGLLLQIVLHESGHAAAAAGYGWEIEDYRPYPNICGGRLVGGCVIASPKDQPVKPSESRNVSAAGSVTSQLSVLALSPLQRSLKPNGFAGKTFRAMLDYQVADFLFYAVIDSVTDFKGDWYAVAQSIDKPTWYFIPPAALSYWLLGKWRQSFERKAAAAPPAAAPQAPAAPPASGAFIAVPTLLYAANARTLAPGIFLAAELP